MIRSAAYIGSFQHEKDCPQEDLPEFAFIGRSGRTRAGLAAGNEWHHEKEKGEKENRGLEF